MRWRLCVANWSGGMSACCIGGSVSVSAGNKWLNHCASLYQSAASSVMIMHCWSWLWTHISSTVASSLPRPVTSSQNSPFVFANSLQYEIVINDHYHPQMWHCSSNVLVASVCVCVCVCLFCLGFNFWKAWSRNFVLVCRCSLRISTSRLSSYIKVIRSRSRSHEQNRSYECNTVSWKKHSKVFLLYLIQNVTDSDKIW